MMKDGYKKGQTLIEVVAAIAVIMVAGTVLVSALTGALANNRLAKERMIATRLSQEGIEWIKQERYRSGSFTSFLSHFTGTQYICINQNFRTFVTNVKFDDVGVITNIPCATSVEVANTNYVRELKFEEIGSMLKITSSVRWASRNELQEIVTTAEMYDYED